MSKSQETFCWASAPMWAVGLAVLFGGCGPEPTQGSVRTDAALAVSGGGHSGGNPGSGGVAGNGASGTLDARSGEAVASTGGQGGNGGTAGDTASDFATSRDASSPDYAPLPDARARFDALPVFWPSSPPANCAIPAIGGRPQADGHHRAGENCMRSGCHLNPRRPEHHAGTDCRGSGCHSKGSPDGSGAPAFLFGGTVYRAGTLAADPGVQVGVKAVQGYYAACSAANGNFWVMAPTGTTALTWTGATARLRNTNGEAPMMSTPAAGCNATTCHTGPLKMTSP